MINKKEYVVERKIHDSIYLINTKQNYLNDKCCLYEINEMEVTYGIKLMGIPQ